MNRLTSTWLSLRRDHGHALAVGGGVILAALFGFLLWGVLDWYIDPDNAKEPSTAKKDLMQAWGFIMAGAAGGVGIYFTWSNLQNARTSLQLTQESSEENLRLTREGQITERFTQAIEQLGATDDEGNKRLEIRLGGIYALERIAQDSLQRDYSTVFAVLSAYVRENTPRSTSTLIPTWEIPTWEKPNTEAEHPLRRRLRRLHTVFTSRETDQEVGTNQPETESQHNRPPTDVQTILEVLSRLRRLEESGIVSAKLGAAIDLRGADLSEAILSEAVFSGANLSLANPSLANLSLANLSGANLSGAYFNPESEPKEVTQERLEEAIRDESTKLPEGLHPPASWTEGEGGHADKKE